MTRYADTWEVSCDHCGEDAGSPCQTPSGSRAHKPHASRIEKAMRQRFPRLRPPTPSRTAREVARAMAAWDYLEHVRLRRWFAMYGRILLQEEISDDQETA